MINMSKFYNDTSFVYNTDETLRKMIKITCIKSNLEKYFLL